MLATTSSHPSCSTCLFPSTAEADARLCPVLDYELEFYWRIQDDIEATVKGLEERGICHSFHDERRGPPKQPLPASTADQPTQAHLSPPLNRSEIDLHRILRTQLHRLPQYRQVRQGC